LCARATVESTWSSALTCTMMIEDRHIFSTFRAATSEGDEAAYSAGVVVELWHVLTAVVSWRWLLGIQVLTEVAHIIFFALILAHAAAKCLPE